MQNKERQSFSNKISENTDNIPITSTFQNKPLQKELSLRLNISGMHCSACSARVEKYLNRLEEVKSASVSLATNTATVIFHETLTDVDLEAFAHACVERIAKMGFTAEILPVSGPVSGNDVTRSYLSSETHNHVSSDQNNTSYQNNLLFERPQHMQANSVENNQSRKLPRYIVEAEQELTRRRKSLQWEIVLAAIVMIVAMGSHFGLPMPKIIDMHASPVNFVLIQFVLTVPILWLGRSFYKVGIRSLMQGAPNMDTLVALGTGAAFLYSVWNSVLVCTAHNSTEMHNALMGIYYESAAMLIALISLGKFLELRSKRKTHDAIRSLMDLRPATATLVQNRENITQACSLENTTQEKNTQTTQCGIESVSENELQKGSQNTGHNDLQSAHFVEIPVEHIRVGDVLFIKSGNQIPVDGVVYSGVANLDVSALTGEFMPITAKQRENVSSGSLCVGQPFYMQAERVGADTVLAKIIALVEEAQGSKAPIAQLADFVSLYFVPFVISIACVAGLLWYFAGGLSFAQSLQIFVAVMVVACPCALGLATPMSIMVATGRAAKLGLLIKNGTVLELAGKIDAIVFDKTGTLTEGKPHIVAEYLYGLSIQDVQEKEPSHEIQEQKNVILSLAAALEKNSDHPISKAFIAFAQKEIKTIHTQNVSGQHYPYEAINFDSFEEVSGRGLYGLFVRDNKKISYYMGNMAFMLEKNIPLTQEEKELYAHIVEEGKSPLLFAQGTAEASVSSENQEAVNKDTETSDIPRILGLFSISDTVRAESEGLIQELAKRGVSTYLLSGDNKASVLKLAQKIGIKPENVTAEVMPSDKESCIVALQKKHNTVAMVGDGINDAPALARAHVGMVMGSGMDVAMEAGDIVLLAGISGVLNTLRLSHATILNIKISLFWAFFYNILLLPVAAGLLLLFGGPTLSPMLAGAAMSLSSFSVVTNALRLRSFK